MRFFFTLLLATVPCLSPITGQSYAVATLTGSDWVGDQGPATEALLFQAEGLATDSAGNLYIADAQGHRVRQVSPTGTIVTIAGTGDPGFSGDGGPAIAAQLNAPYGLAFDPRGNLYIADLGNARVRRVAPDGTIITVASAPLVSPRNVAVDLQGNLYISDFDGQCVYKIGPDGALTPFIKSGLSYPTALAVNSSGVLYIADSGNHLIRKFLRGALISAAAASTPTGLTFDPSGAMYIADSSAGQIVRIPPAGAVSVLSVSARDIAFGPDGSLYAASGALVQRVLPGDPRIVAGGGSTALGDQGNARDARLNHPASVAADDVGNVYIADRDNNRIRRVALDGIITTIAGTGVAGDAGDGGLATLAKLNEPSSVRWDAGQLYIDDTGNHRVRKFSPGGIMLAADGSILRANTAVDREGNVYYSDAVAARVWRRAVSGTVTELGSGRWISPRGLAISDAGDLFVADSGLGRVVRVDASGVLTPLATDTSIGSPWDVALGPAGALYVADLDGNRVYMLTPVPVAPVQPLDAVNAASLLPGPLAPGMLVAIRGSVTGVNQVFFAGFAAAILSIDDTRILVQAPMQIAGRDHVPIEFLRDQGFSLAVASAAVADAAPALFTTNSGQASAVNQEGTLNSLDHPVPRGAWISLYGTGEGVEGLPVSVRIGGYAAEVLYSGAVAGYPGLFQINVRVPGMSMTPGILNVVVTVGQADSPPGVTIAVQ